MLRPALTWLLLGALASTQLGCSALFVDRVPDRQRYLHQAEYTCTTNRPVAGIDAQLAASFALFGVLIYVLAESFGSVDENDALLILVPFGVPTALFAGSAIYGFTNASDCDDAMEELNQRFLAAHRATTTAQASDAQPTVVVPQPTDTQPTVIAPQPSDVSAPTTGEVVP